MPTPVATRIIIGLSAGLWLLLAFVLDAPVDQRWLKALGGIASVVVVLVLVFDRWLWRLMPVSISKRPNLRGTWKATYEFQWPPETPTQTKDCYLVVRQTYSTLSVDMLFDISTSQSPSADILSQNGRYSLWWSYLSLAGTLHQAGNPPHRGAAQLVVSLKPKTSLAGDYWTERKTTGSITTSGRHRHCFDDYANANAADYNGAGALKASVAKVRGWLRRG